MRRSLIAGAVVILAFALLTACGGDGGEGGSASRIRTGSGLAVAAAGGQLGAPGTGEDSFSEAATIGGTGGGAAGAAPMVAPSLADLRVAPDYYPWAPGAQASLSGITVQGYGSASTEADSAVIEFTFYRAGAAGVKPFPEPVPEVPTRESGAQTPPPIRETDLQAVIDAVRNAGASEVEFLNPYGDPYNAVVRATLDNIDNVDAVASAATEAAAGVADLNLGSTNVTYTLNDCSALEQAAMEAAVADAAKRSDALAAAIGVSRGSVIGVSHYSYSPFGGSPCSSGFTGGPFPIAGTTYVQGGPREVHLFVTVTVTYAIQ